MIEIFIFFEQNRRPIITKIALAHDQQIKICSLLQNYAVTGMFSNPKKLSVYCFYFQFSTGKVFVYWLGTKESAVTYYGNRLPKWFNYDKNEDTFFQWFAGFPTRFSGPSCLIVMRGCRRGCWVQWQNRPCSKHDDIDLIICESRGNGYQF